MSRPFATVPVLNTNLDTPDEVFLGQFPIRDRLGPEARQDFDEGALFWREMLPIVERYKREATPIVERAEADLAREGLALSRGMFLALVKEFLRQPSPAACSACQGCDGIGTSPNGEPCPDCSGKGYRLPWFEGWDLDLPEPGDWDLD